MFNLKSFQIQTLTFCILLLLCVGAVPARAGTVLTFTALPASVDLTGFVSFFDSSFFNFSDPPSPFAVMDNLSGGGAMTIDITWPDIPVLGEQDISIEIVALSLVSVDPVDIGGTLHDIFIDIDSSTSSGSAVLDISPTGAYTVDSFFDVFFEITFDSQGDPPILLHNDPDYHVTGDGTIPPEAIEIPYGEWATSIQVLRLYGEGEAWIEEEPLVMEPIPVPPAVGIGALGMGLLGLVMRQKRRR